MREILFRGKTAVIKKWIQGNLGQHHQTKAWFIQTPNECGTLKTELVIPETVGQYTGLTDKNGKMIFEGDECKNEFGEVGVIFFDQSSAMFIIEYGESLDDWDYIDIPLEVIGNIHDNPELLEGK